MTAILPTTRPDAGTDRFEDNLTIPVNVKYTSIGGSIDRTLSIDVDDDSPHWQVVSWSGVDDEGAPLPGYAGIDGGAGDEGFPGVSATMTINSSFAGGADGLQSVALDVDQIALLNASLRATDGTPDGAPIAFALEGADLVARISDATSPLDGREVFRVHPEATSGQFTFTLASPIFHSGQGEQTASATLVLKGTDRDGDATSVSIGVPVNRRHCRS